MLIKKQTLISSLGYLFIALIFLHTSPVMAKDFGSYGNTYKIAEIDIEEEIKKKLAIIGENGELEKFQENYKKAVTKQIKNPNRVLGISNALKDSSRKYDPTSYLEKDIVIPKGLTTHQSAKEIARENIKKISNNEEETIEYKILHKAGTAINPLKYMLFNEPLIFIDGNEEKQLQYARDYQDKNQLAKIILIDGKPGFKEIDGKEYHYFFDQWGAYSEKFQIVKVPSVVWQKNGEEVLTIDEIKIESDRK